MDKLYSRKAKVIKIIYCAFLPVLTVIISHICKIENGVMYLTACLIPSGCLYTVPFWMTVLKLKKIRAEKISPFVLTDLLTCAVPTVLSSVITEIISALVAGEKEGAGIMTLAVIMLVIVISLLFWLLYYLFSRKNNKPARQKNRP